MLVIDWRDKEVGRDEIPMSWFKRDNPKSAIWEHAMKLALVFGWPVRQSVGTDSPSIV